MLLESIVVRERRAAELNTLWQCAFNIRMEEIRFAVCFPLAGKRCGVVCFPLGLMGEMPLWCCSSHKDTKCWLTCLVGDTEVGTVKGSPLEVTACGAIVLAPLELAHSGNGWIRTLGSFAVVGDLVQTAVFAPLEVMMCGANGVFGVYFFIAQKYFVEKKKNILRSATSVG